MTDRKKPKGEESGSREQGDHESGSATPGEGRPEGERPAAGPHATPKLTNKEATPGAGALPDPEDPADSTEAVSG